MRSLPGMPLLETAEMVMLIGLLLLTAEPDSVMNDQFRLVCAGTGTATRPSTGIATAYGSYGESAVITSTVDGRVGFEGVMRIDINGKEGSIRVPGPMLPAIRGGNEGVIKLKDINIRETEITARVDYNFLNKPRVIIDRLTGTVSLDDRMTKAQFSGRCEAFDPSKHQRAF